ncbi:nuclear transport factor 2 family protein [Nocardia nova]|uniref:nuclear transport factor 2 family protein n=1 Tax=Nocardia nova TaxID=37330 RepID=UPI0033DBBB83
MTNAAYTGNATDREGLRRLLDKEEIRENLYRYARGVDRCDWELFRSTYHPDAHDDHGPYKGDVDGLVEWVSRRHALIEQSQHMFGQIAIDFLSDDVAVSETYEITTQRYSNEAEETIRGWVGDMQVADDDRLEIIMYARMVDRTERRNGAWKVAEREVVIEQVYWRIISADEVSTVSVPLVRGPEDAVFRFLRAGV